MKHGKTYNAVKEKIPQEAVDFETAFSFLQEHTRSSFDETVELHVRLGVNTEKSEQAVRGSVVLPEGAASKQRVAVFTDDSKKQTAAKEAGADIVGGADLVGEIEEKGSIDADVTIATPDMMQTVAKVAKILGPKGLMPSPKTGTVTDDVEKAVNELAAGKLTFKMDQSGNIHAPIGKASWDTGKLVKNAQAVVEAIRENRPPSAKGELISKVFVTTTMGPGVRVAA